MGGVEMSWSDEAIRVLDALCDKFGLAIEVGKDDALPLLQAIARKVAIADGASAVATLVVLWAAIFAAARLYFLLLPNVIKDEADQSEMKTLGIWIIALFVLVAVALTAHSLPTIITCIYAPELHLIERLMQIGGGA